jgi:hypothetical protein
VPLKNKYNATRWNGFHSKLEASVHQLLLLREKANEIKIISLQHHVYLTKARVHTIPDFKCLDLKSNQEFFVEAKGFESPRWPTIKKLWKFYGPAPIEIWKGSFRRPYLDETIVPSVDGE